MACLLHRKPERVPSFAAGSLYEAGLTAMARNEHDGSEAIEQIAQALFLVFFHGCSSIVADEGLRAATFMPFEK
jgi:hypothetical protein